MIAIIASILQTASIAALARPRQRQLCVSSQLNTPNKSSLGELHCAPASLSPAEGERLRLSGHPSKLLI